MSDNSKAAGTSGPPHRLVEAGLAIFMIVFALIVIGGSVQVGVGWGDNGPRAGFFPFYCALFVLGASIINLIQSWRSGQDGLFAEWGQLGRVVSVVIPSAIYVAAVPYIGIYVASAFLIAFFMKWIGRYGWAMVFVIAIPVPIAAFVVFERWFLVPLPKGPLEQFLGF